MPAGNNGRRQRPLRSWFRRERMSIPCAVAEALHHSSAPPKYDKRVVEVTQHGTLRGPEDRHQGAEGGRHAVLHLRRRGSACRREEARRRLAAGESSAVQPDSRRRAVYRRSCAADGRRGGQWFPGRPARRAAAGDRSGNSRSSIILFGCARLAARDCRAGSRCSSAAAPEGRPSAPHAARVCVAAVQPPGNSRRTGC